MITRGMLPFFYKEKRQLKICVCIIACMLLVVFNSCAQDGQRVPDSLRVDDTVSFEGKQDEETFTNAIDTVSSQKSVEEDTAVFRAVPDSVIATYKKQKDFEYANDPAYWVKAKPEKEERSLWDRFLDGLNKKWLRGFVIFLLIALLVYALYKIIAENRLYLFYSSPKKIAQEHIHETDISFEDIEQKIHEAVHAGDFRTAFRFMYLKALKKSADKELIQFHANGTNQEYVNQMSSHPAQKDFRFLTNVYEHVWYGGFTLTQMQFDSLQTQFNNLYHLIDQ